MNDLQNLDVPAVADAPSIVTTTVFNEVTGEFETVTTEEIGLVTDEGHVAEAEDLAADVNVDVTVH